MRRGSLAIGLATSLSLAAGASPAAGPPSVLDRPPLLAESGRLALRVFTDEDGLPQTSAQAMAVDASGYVWVGTQDGAGYYDGRRWTRVDMPNAHRSNYVKCLQATPDGAMWFGTDGGGVHRLLDGRWTSFDAGSGLPSTRVRALLAARGADGTLEMLAGTLAGLSRLVAGRWRDVPLDGGAVAVSSLAETPDALWVGTTSGLLRRTGGAWTRLGTADGLPDGLVTALLPGSAEPGAPRLWIGTEGGLARLDGGAIRKVDGPRGPTRIRSLCETAAAAGGRALWAGTSGQGLYRYEAGAWRQFTVGSGLPGAIVLSLLPTGSAPGGRALWIGTDGSGVARLVEGALTAFDETSGLPNSLVYSFAETRTPSGTDFWMATYSAGIVRFSPAGRTVFDPASGFPARMVFALLSVPSADGTDDLWAATDGFGVARFHSGRWQVEGAELHRPHCRVLCLGRTTAEDGSPIVWAGTVSDGLLRYAHGEWTVLDTAGLPSPQIRSLLETRGRDGRRVLWIGTQQGLATIEDGKLSAYRGMPASASPSIVSLAEVVRPGGGRSLWVGTFSGGLGIVDLDDARQPWRAISTATTPRLPNNVVNAILQDRGGRVWVLTNKGLTRFTPRAPTPDDASDFATRTFTTEDGLPRNEGNQNALYLDRAGRLWVGTTFPSVIDPARVVDDTEPKPLRIQSVSVSGQPARASELRALPHHRNRVTFEYSLLSYFHESERRYRTQLVGLDEAASEWSADDKKDYAGLPPGAYVFKVWGRDHAGNVSGPVEVPFVIRPAPWRTGWAYLAYLALLAAIAWLALQLRVRALRRRNRQLEAVVRGKTRDLEQALASTQQAVQRIETLRAATEALAGSLDRQQVLQLILSELRKVVDYDSASVQELEGRQLRIIAGVGFENPDDILGLTFAVDAEEAPNREVVRTRAPFILANTDEYPLFRSGYNAPAPILCWMGVPLVIGDRLIGMITLDKRGPGFYTDEHARLALTFAHQAAVSMENARLLTREKEAHERADQASLAKSAFVASMSHELRTPLNSILGFVQVMQRAPRSAEDREHLAIITRSGEHLLSLINEVLSISRIESGRMELATSCFDLREMLGSLEKMFEPKAATQGLAFQVRAAADLPRAVSGDAVKLRQILINILGNAFKFTRRGSVSLSAAWRPGRASFEVADSGPGLTEEESAALFTPFTQTGEGQKAGGAGLGLALSRSYARLMGGDVTVDAAPGRGSVFRVEVDLEETPDVDVQERPARRVVGLAPGQARPRLLVVDDSEESRLALSRLLASAGFEVAEAGDGQEAVEAWRRDPPALIWMDVRMPVMDGIRAVAVIREEESARGLSRTPIVAVTASAFEHEREAIAAAGFDGYVAKPFREHDVFAQAAAHLPVELVYAEPEAAPTAPAAPIALTPQRMGALPADWLDSFREAVVQGNIEKAVVLTVGIEDQDALLAAELRTRLKAYRLDEIESAMDV